MIVSCSRRTDIPACYPAWFMNRLRAGYCVVSNPFNPHQRRRVSLRREDVDALVFWTKNVRPLLPSIDELISAGHRFMVQFTLNPYPPILEPGMPRLEDRLADFETLSRLIGKNRVVWRYDPIIISNQTPFSFHRQAFLALAERLSEVTERVVVSVVQLYRKTLRGLMGLSERGLIFEQHAADSAEMNELLYFLAETAGSYGLEIVSCASERDLSVLRISPGRCIDGELFTSLWGLQGPWKKDPGQRPACGCTVSVDIGATNTCQHGCPYCYATTNHEQSRIQFLQHDSHAEILDFSSRCSSK